MYRIIYSPSDLSVGVGDIRDGPGLGVESPEYEDRIGELDLRTPGGGMSSAALSAGVLDVDGFSAGVLSMAGLSEGFLDDDGLSAGVLSMDGLSEGLLDDDGLSEGVLALDVDVLSEGALPLDVDGMSEGVLGAGDLAVE